MELTKHRITIAIDGHSSCGKSTVAKDIARMLGYTYIDSGAMYRVVTLFCMEHQLIQGEKVNETELASKIDDLQITFTFEKELQKYITWMNGVRVEEKIRTIDVSNKVSIVSKIGFVRERMVSLQQQMGQQGGIVMDGRDIGTVVFPNAELKIFMTASAKVRAQRRFKELTDAGQLVSFDEVLKNIEQRDFIDSNREIAPLRQAPDAIVIDNSYLTRDEQLEKILILVNQRITY